MVCIAGTTQRARLGALATYTGSSYQHREMTALNPTQGTCFADWHVDVHHYCGEATLTTREKQEETSARNIPYPEAVTRRQKQGLACVLYLFLYVSSHIKVSA